MEVHQLKDENQQLHEEVLSLRKVAAALRVGGGFVNIGTVWKSAD